LGTEKGGKALADLEKKLENVTDEKERIAILTQEFEKMKNGVSKAGMVTGSSVESMLDKIEQMGPKGKADLDQYVASLQKSG
jgi:uncharacterized small protein (DUF1192 family)